ncbi:hypothetical protein SOPP22_12280 [Shewanella sp. OPT22]|nr:hypothetical protein SOPP22_12280 [Shewanella sp. OPT22]
MSWLLSMPSEDTNTNMELLKLHDQQSLMAKAAECMLSSIEGSEISDQSVEMNLSSYHCSITGQPINFNNAVAVNIRNTFVNKNEFNHKPYWVLMSIEGLSAFILNDRSFYKINNEPMTKKVAPECLCKEDIASLKDINLNQLRRTGLEKTGTVNPPIIRPITRKQR